MCHDVSKSKMLKNELDLERVSVWTFVLEMRGKTDDNVKNNSPEVYIFRLLFSHIEFYETFL